MSYLPTLKAGQYTCRYMQMYRYLCICMGICMCMCRYMHTYICNIIIYIIIYIQKIYTHCFKHIYMCIPYTCKHEHHRKSSTLGFIVVSSTNLVWQFIYIIYIVSSMVNTWNQPHQLVVSIQTSAVRALPKRQEETSSEREESWKLDSGI